LTSIKVTGYNPTPEGLQEALNGTEIVLIPAGVPRKPGMTRDGMRIIYYSLTRNIH
jgi:malate dehydrogenase